MTKVLEKKKNSFYVIFFYVCNIKKLTVLMISVAIMKFSL
jgi:hypothetical protein